jgi:CRP-like cAMP-binding protein
VIEEGSQGDEFYIILSGEVEVMKGGRPLTILGPGVHFGEMALVDHSPRSATVRAREATRLMALSRAAFYSLVRTEPVLSSKLLWSFVQVLSHRLRATNEALSGASETITALPPFADTDTKAPVVKSASGASSVRSAATEVASRGEDSPRLKLLDGGGGSGAAQLRNAKGTEPSE